MHVEYAYSASALGVHHHPEMYRVLMKIDSWQDCHRK